VNRVALCLVGAAAPAALGLAACAAPGDVRPRRDTWRDAASQTSSSARTSPSGSSLRPPADAAFRVQGLPPTTRVTVSDSRACALTRAGSVWCWDFPDGSATAPLRSSTPAPVKGLVGVRDLSGSCALTDRVWCDNPTPRAAPVGRALSLSRDGEGCAVQRGGRVTCWYEPAPWDDAPEYPTVPGVAAAAEVAVGPFGACAVTKAGQLVCWGAASLIPWAPSSPASRPPPPTRATRLVAPTNVRTVSLRGGMPCLVQRSGRVHCWAPEDASTLLPQNPLPPSAQVRGISDAVAVSGGLVLHADGSLSEVRISYQTSGDPTFRDAEFRGASHDDVVSVDGTPDHGCAVDTHGAVACWSSP